MGCLSNSPPPKASNDKPHGLAARVVRFADFLKAHGFTVFQSSVHDALRSLEAIELSSKVDFFAALRANFVTNDMEWALFFKLFEEFWTQRNQEDRDEKRQKDGRRIEGALQERASLTDPEEGESTGPDDVEVREWLEGITYSPVSKIQKKDLGRFDKADVDVAHLAVKNMMKPFRIQASRRSGKGRKPGRMDFSRIMKRSLKTEGLPLALFYKEKKRRLKRLVVLADVSGSMDRYARFVMPFILGLRGIGSGAEVFVFSTTLASVTTMVRHLSIEKAVERIAEEVPEWSGGTRIGYSLHQFNQGPGQRLLSLRTVVVILSDGWDLGGKGLLKREMAVLSRKAFCVIWLNPLAGKSDYEPLCQGMRIAMPYVDHLLPADSLESLKRVGKLLSRVMVH